MHKDFKRNLGLFSALGLMAFAQIARAGTVCPSDVIKPFVGQWNGQALLVQAGGATQQFNNIDVFSVLDCQSFRINVSYLNSAGAVARIVDLKAFPDPSGQVGLYSITGTITEGSVVNPMTGTIKQIQEGTLLGSFLGSIGGKLAYLNELMNVTAIANGENQLVRTVQMFAGQSGGEYLGTRVVSDRIIPSR